MSETAVNWWKISLLAVVIIGLMTASFFVGRSVAYKPGKPTTEYVKGDTIRDSIPYPVPYEVVVTVDTVDIIKRCVKDGIYSELFPTKIVTEYIEVTKEDTTSIMKDWAATRKYKETLFDSDTLGTCIINATVQYNRLKSFDYDFVPVTKTITVPEYRIKRFTPFVGAGISTFPSVGAEAGLFINQSWGFSVDGSYYFNTKNLAGMTNWSVGIKVLKAF